MSSLLRNGRSLYPFSAWDGVKTLPLGEAYPYMEYKGVPPPPPPRHLTNSTLFVTPVLNYSCLIIIPSWLWDNRTPVTWSTDLHFKCPFTTDPEVTKQSRSETTIKKYNKGYYRSIIKPRKQWTPKLFLKRYCVWREKPTRREKN